MRLPRQKPEGPSVFHCRSHLVPEVPYLIPLEKHSFTRRFRRLAAFHDMTVLTHSVMSNHFHILVRSPKKVRLTHAQLLKKLRRFYGPRSREVLEFEHALKGHPQLLATLRARYLARIGELSVFMKELKEGFSRWYNRRHDRQGTLWTQRFASTVVEDTPQMVLPAAAYIDLNAVRAGMVGDPRAYGFCGYGEALGGGAVGRAGLGAFLPRGRWRERLAEFVHVCRAEACQAMRGEQTEQHARRELGVDYGGTTEDGLFTLEAVYCLGNCAAAPTVMVDEKLYGRVTPERLAAILAEWRNR